MTKGDKFVLILMILGFLAGQGIIPTNAPEEFIKDELGFNFLEDIGTWSTNFNPEKPIEGTIILLWIIIKNFSMPIIIGAVWIYIKNNYITIIKQLGGQRSGYLTAPHISYSSTDTFIRGNSIPGLQTRR